MTSVHGRCAYPCRGAYGASKYALEGFSDALRLEMKKFGVTVSILEPGQFGHATCIHSGAQVRTESYLLVFRYSETHIHAFCSMASFKIIKVLVQKNAY